jgi:hypothetical protein
VQTLHVGSFYDEPEVLARLHHEFIPANGLRLAGTHHEIYLSASARSLQTGSARSFGNRSPPTPHPAGRRPDRPDARAPGNERLDVLGAATVAADRPASESNLHHRPIALAALRQAPVPMRSEAAPTGLVVAGADSTCDLVRLVTTVLSSTIRRHPHPLLASRRQARDSAHSA